ncbi:hypothetical protein FZ194_17260 [Salmonella enterica]|nr:hypothetical protein [Salmonella enterica]
MECKVSDLVKRGHDQAAELKSSCGAVDVRDVAQLISDLATQLDVQLVRSNALAAEYARLSDIAKGGAFVMQKALMKYEFGVGMTMQAEDFIRDVRSKTPATDAFLAEVRAQGVDAAIEAAKNLVAQEYEYKDFKAAQSDCCMYPGSDLVGKVEMTEWLVDFAAQLRKGGNQ